MTTAVNLGMTATAAMTGAILARFLGPEARGEYAAVTAWFWVALVLTEVGQTAAVTYYVSKDRENASHYIVTSQRLLTVAGLALLVGGWTLAPLLARGGGDLTFCYRLMFAASLGALASAAHCCALQSLDVLRWNIVRAIQPVMYLIYILVALTTSHLSLKSACVGLAVTVNLQGALGYMFVRRLGIAGGRSDLIKAKLLLKYGSSQLLGSGPALANTRLDQLVLSQTVRASQLGYYAVAVTLTSLVVPAVAAIGNLAFPRLAADGRSSAARRDLIRRSLRASILLSVVVAGLLAVTAQWSVPLVFGSGYSSAIPLVWILAPGGVFLAVGQVVGDVLRGSGRPLAVAVGQGAGAAATVVLLVALLPRYGVVGAAWASTIAYFITVAIMMVLLVRSGREKHGYVEVQAHQGDPTGSSDTKH